MVAGLALMSTEWRLQHQQYHHHQLHGGQSREFIHETAVFSYPCIILLSYPQIQYDRGTRSTKSTTIADTKLHTEHRRHIPTCKNETTKHKNNIILISHCMLTSYDNDNHPLTYTAAATAQSSFDQGFLGAFHNRHITIIICKFST